MKIAIGADHAGWEAKDSIGRTLGEAGYEIVDVGTNGPDSVDYPDLAAKVARYVRDADTPTRGILVCGTGIGVGIAANKCRGVRAATCHDEYTARMSRAHNDANVLCMGSRVLQAERMMPIVQAFLATEYEGGRHDRRVEKIDRIEEEESRIPSAPGRPAS